MVATTTLTASSLYATDATMRAFVADWVREHRCPLPFVDFLLEHDLYAAAEAARWAATEEDRRANDEQPYGPPFPQTSGFVGSLAIQNGGWLWCDDAHGSRSEVPTNRVPSMREKGSRFLREFPTPTAAILWLLDNWKAGA